MRHWTTSLFIILLITCFAASRARANALICETHNDCNDGDSSYGHTSANPSLGSAIRLNPSAIPLVKGYGIETIDYRNSLDFALTKGIGRIGAALSPSNSEGTFFGPPSIELPQNYLARELTQSKYQSAKFTIGSAFNVYSNNRRGLTRFELNLGAMIKYNRDTNGLTPGTGLNGTLGFLTFGYSFYVDQTQLDYSIYGLPIRPITTYNVESYSLGVFFDHFIFDYSTLRLVSDSIATVNVATGSILVDKFILVAAFRNENSDRVAYDSSAKTLVNQQVKSSSFGGLQYHFTSSLMLGAFYNYYLLREISIGLTIFL